MISTLSPESHKDLLDGPAKADPTALALPTATRAPEGFNRPSLNYGPSPLWAILRESEECTADFAQLIALSYQKGHREGHAEGVEPRRICLLTAMVSMLAFTILVSALFVWERPTGETAINRIYTKTSPAVANIQVKSAGVTGSGVVFDQNGYLLTNYHVIKAAQNDQDILVQLPGLDPVPAKLVGYDIATDLAVLQVNAPPEHLTVVDFGDPNAVQAGDLAVAIGSPFGLSNSLTVGHISAVGRRLMSDDPHAPDIEGVLQTDAAINPGNSGGPLLNASGEVIGINTRIESPSGGSAGLGFAIPSNTVLRVAREIIARGYVRYPMQGPGVYPRTKMGTVRIPMKSPTSSGQAVHLSERSDASVIIMPSGGRHGPDYAFDHRRMRSPSLFEAVVITGK